MEKEKIIIIGGTGSWGHGLIKELLNRGAKQIRVFARNESQMVKLSKEFGAAKVEPIIGDIRDKEALLKACRDCDTLYHLAALKHVPICEKMPTEAIATNVIGTQNVIDCAVEAQINKVVYTSTDRAINANCVYGSTKLLGEKLMLTASERSKRTKFIVFRGGNLLGSAGSVVPLFKKQIEESGTVTLTDERMTRFLITIERASQLLVDVAERGAGGEIFLPVMPSICIKEIAGYLLAREGLNQNNIKVIGIRPGEKLHEQLLLENEMDKTFRLNEDLFLISKEDHHSWAANGIMKKCGDYAYQSDKNVLSRQQTDLFLQAANI